MTNELSTSNQRATNELQIFTLITVHLEFAPGGRDWHLRYELTDRTYRRLDAHMSRFGYGPVSLHRTLSDQVERIMADVLEVSGP